MEVGNRRRTGAWIGRMIRARSEPGETGQEPAVRSGGNRALQSPRLIATTAFNPPNANEFDSTARTGFSRATFGT